MEQGLAIFGLNGVGKSTLAYALAKETGYFLMDAEDYYFPDQKESRQAALECRYGVKCRHLGELPFSVPREKDAVQQLAFRNTIAERDEKSVRDSVSRLRCPVIILDGMQSISCNLEKILQIVGMV